MTKTEYQSLYEDRKEIDMPDAFIRSWLNDLTYSMRMAENCSYDLHYGKFNTETEEFEYNIESCTHRNFNDYHIYCGIEKLAEVAGVTLQKIVDDDENTDYQVKLYFYYNGIQFFELRRKEEDTKGAFPVQGGDQK